MASPGDSVRELRMILGWSGAELARRSGLDQPEISKIESGANKMTSARVRNALADAFMLTHEELLDLIRNGNPQEFADRTRYRVETQERASENGHGEWPNLEAAMTYHRGRWSDATVAVGRALARDVRFDPDGPTWTDILDGVEKSLKESGAIKRLQEAKIAHFGPDQSEDDDIPF